MLNCSPCFETWAGPQYVNTPIQNTARTVTPCGLFRFRWCSENRKTLCSLKNRVSKSQELSPRHRFMHPSTRAVSPAFQAAQSWVRFPLDAPISPEASSGAQERVDCASVLISVESQPLLGLSSSQSVAWDGSAGKTVNCSPVESNSRTFGSFVGTKGEPFSVKRISSVGVQ